MPAKITINLNENAEMERIREAGNQALTDMRDPIIDDINRYVPVGGGRSQNGGGGALRSSATLHSDQEVQDGKLTRSYGPEELHYTDVMARKEWDLYAEQQHQEEWIAQIKKRMMQHL